MVLRKEKKKVYSSNESNKRKTSSQVNNLQADLIYSSVPSIWFIVKDFKQVVNAIILNSSNNSIRIR